MENPETVVESLLYAAQDGYISVEELNEVYAENLDIVLEHAEALLADLDGKTVVTADHGELMGKTTGFWKFAHPKRCGTTGPPFGHPNQVYVPELRKVPWFEFETDNRPDITDERPPTTDEVDEKSIEQRLEALGYKIK